MKKQTILLLLVFGALLTIGYAIIVTPESSEEKYSCGLDVGPIYGEPIKVKMDEIKFDQLFEVENAKIGFNNLKDALPVKIFRINDDSQVEWAYQFKQNSELDLEYSELSNLKLNNNDNLITFFNNSHSEPGRLYLDKDFNLKFMCLKMF